MMATLRIRFVTSSGFVSAQIRAAQLSFLYTHAEVELPDGAGYLGAHADGGVQIRPVGYDVAPGMHELFIALTVTDAQAARFYAYLRDQLGKRYDFYAIADFAEGLFIHPDRLRPPGAWLEPDRWFCSELVLAALIHAGVFVSELVGSARGVTPQILAFVADAVAKLAPREPAPAPLAAAA